MIYLFCNQGFGQRFLEVAAEAARQGRARITVVFSDRYRPVVRRAIWSRVTSLVAAAAERRRFAARTGMPLARVADVNAPEFTRGIGREDHGIVAGFNQIFREETIGRFGSIVNFHPSILPLYRGPAPSYWCIANGEETTGFTLHAITGRIDAGEILTQGTVPIDSVRDPDLLDRRIAERAEETFRVYLAQLETGAQIARTILDAARIYKRHVDYASFPS